MEKDIAAIINYTPGKISAESELEMKDTYIKGYHLYKRACSECHGTRDRGRDTIPAFTFSQLDSYNNSIKRGDPKNHAVMKKLTADQTRNIMVFLFYKTMAKRVKNAK